MADSGVSSPPAQAQTQTPPAQARDSKIREKLSITLVIVSVGGVLALGLITLWIDHTLDAAKYVMGVILPLFGTWVGTVLAFYFTKENFNAASQSVADMARQVSGLDKLRTIAVSAKMMPAANVTRETLKPGDEGTKKLSDLLTSFPDVERILLLKPSKAVFYLIYKAEINAYLGEVALGKAAPKAALAGAAANPPPLTVATVTLQDLIDSSDRRKTLFTGSFDFVAVTATLADAKVKMDKIPHCNDVFVTKTGDKDEELLGWITDNTLMENARV